MRPAKPGYSLNSLSKLWKPVKFYKIKVTASFPLGIEAHDCKALSHNDICSALCRHFVAAGHLFEDNCTQSPANTNDVDLVSESYSAFHR